MKIEKADSVNGGIVRILDEEGVKGDHWFAVCGHEGYERKMEQLGLKDSLFS